MRKKLAILVLILGLASLARAQQKWTLSAAATTCTTSNTSCLIYLVDAASGGATFTVGANASANTLQFEASGDGGATWVAFNVTPSNGTTAVTSTTSTGTWQGNVAGYTAVRIRMSTLVSGTATVSIITSLASARSGGGGGGGGGTVTGTAGQTALFSGTNTVTGGSGVIDMAGVAGADLGAKMNTCQALSTVPFICDGSNLTGALTLSTAVTTSAPVQFRFCGQSISQSAAFIAANANSGIVGCATQATTITKAANIDQITLQASKTTASYLTLAGVKASFTGNGIVTSSTASNVNINNNVISAEAGDDIDDNSSGGGNQITANVLGSWGTHAYEATSSAPQSIVSSNVMTGDGTATGAGLLNTGCSKVISNTIKDSNATQILFDDSACSATTHTVSNNTMIETGAAIAFKMSSTTEAGGNVITQSGGTGPAVQIGAVTGGKLVGNQITATNADAFDSTAGQLLVSHNSISVGITASGNHFGIALQGDQIGNMILGNEIAIADSANAGNTDACILNNPTGTHNLNITVAENHCAGTNSGSVTVYGFELNNSNSLNTNWSQLVRDMGCVHITTCIDRVDAQNNASLYANIQPGDATLDAGTGSSSDVWTNFSTTFANLPSPSGVGSYGYCTDCIQARVVNAGSSSGGSVFRANAPGMPSGAQWLSYARPVMSVTSGGQAFSSTTAANVTNFSFPVLLHGHYGTHCWLRWVASANTAGLDITVTGPTATTAVVSYEEIQSGVALTNLSVQVFGTKATGVTTLTNLTGIANVDIAIDDTNAGTVQLQASATGTGTVTLTTGFCYAW